MFDRAPVRHAAVLFVNLIFIACATAADDTPAVVVAHDVMNQGRITNRQSGQFVEYLCDLIPSMWAEKLHDGSFEGLSAYKVQFLKTDFQEKPWYPRAL